MKKKFSKEVIIGLSILVALLVLFFGINYLKGINMFKAANYYYVSYTNVSGLTVSSPVTINGYKIGFVREIQYEYDNPGHILVELSLDKEFKVPCGTEALLKTDMLGTASIELSMNDTTAFHEVGDKIIGKTPAGLMDNLSKDVLPSVASIMPKVDSLMTTVNALIGDPAIANSIRRLDNITANLEATSAQLNKMVSTMKPTAENVNSISENLNGITASLNEVSAELRDAPLDSAMTNIYNTTENVKQITEKLNSDKSSLGLLLNDDKLYNNLNGAAGSLDSLLIDVKKNPKRYISIKLL